MMEFLRMLSNDSLTLWGLNVLLQVTIIATLGLLAARLIANNAVLKWWVLGAVLSLVLLSPGLALLSQAIGIGAVTFERSPSAAPATEVGPVAVRTESPISGTPGNSRSVPATAPSTLVDDALLRPAPEAFSTRAIDGAASASRKPPRQHLSQMEIVFAGLHALMAVWVIGACCMLVRMLRGWGHLCRIRRRAAEINDERLACWVAEACDRLNLQTHPALLQSDEVSSPLAAGVLRPVILLPRSLADSLSPQQLQDVLLHEVAHVARRDQVIVIVQNVATSLFWIHPLVQMLNRQFAQAREEICDNYVLHSTEAPSYSRTLLELAESSQAAGFLTAAVGVLDDWSLEARVAGLLRRGRNRTTRLTGRNSTVVVLVFGALLAVGSIATVTVSATESNDQSDKPVGTTLVSPDSRSEPRADHTDRRTTTAEKSRLPMPASTEFHFSGRVVDPQGRPAAGAKVYFARQGAVPLAVADNNGRFEFTHTKGRLPNNAAWGNIRLVAVAEGFGIAISPALRFEDTGQGKQDLYARNPNKKFSLKSPPRILKLVQDDVPIQGRIVDLEGQPVPDVTIQLRFVNKAYTRFAFDAVTTDNDGRFEIRGIGRDRVVRLVAKGDHTAFSVFFARTKDVEAETKTNPQFNDPFELPLRPESTHRVTYGAKLTHAVAPSVPVEGRITDATTGEPLSGVTVYAYELANNSESGRREEFNGVTDADGRYRLIGLPIGTNKLVTSTDPGSSYLPAGAHVTVKDDVKAITRDITITKGILLRGQAVDAESGKPLLGYVDYSAMEGNEHFAEAKTFQDAVGYLQHRTDRDGRFELPVLPGKGYLAFRTRSSGERYPLGVLSAEAAATQRPNQPFLPSRPVLLMPTSYNNVTLIDPAPDEQEMSADFRLNRAPDVTVKVVDGDGQPVLGTSVEEVLTFNGTGRGNSVEVPGDSYQVQYFTPDNPTVVIARHQQQGLIGRLEINDLRDADLTLTLKAAAKIRGRIVDDEGNPRVVRIDGYGRIFATDDDGRFELPLVIPDFPITVRAIHRQQLQLLGTVFEDLTLAEGEVRNLGDVTIKEFQ